MSADRSSPIPKSWEWAPLRTLGQWVGGGTPSKSEDRFWTGGDLPWVSPKDMKVFRLATTKDSITKEAERASAAKLLPEQSVLIVTRSGILRHTLPIAVTTMEACLNQDLKGLVPAKGIDPQYVAYGLIYRANDVLRACSKHGTTVQSIEFPKLLKYELPIAPFAEQKRIVEAIEEQFSRLDAGVESLNRAKHNLTRLRAAALRGAFIILPKRRFGDYLREPLRNGKSPRQSVSGSVRVLTLTAVTEGDFSESNTKLADLTSNQIKDLWLQPDDILIERGNTSDLVGIARRYNGPPKWAIFPDLLIRARVNDEMHPRFAELALQSAPLRRYFKLQAKGIAGSMPKIDQATILEAPMPATSFERQLLIIAEVERQFSIIDAMEQAIDRSLERAARLRRSILRDAFAGRLVPQDSSDEPASVLLGRISAERAKA